MKTHALGLIAVFALFCWVSNMDCQEQEKEAQHAIAKHKKADERAEREQKAAEFNRLAAEAEYFTGMKAGMK